MSTRDVRPRRAIQIVTAPGFATNSGHYEPAVFALCDDGTIWRGWHPDTEWIQMPPIPAEEMPAPAKFCPTCGGRGYTRINEARGAYPGPCPDCRRKP